MGKMIITDERLELLRKLYPEAVWDIDHARTEVASRGRLPSLIKSIGKREGTPEDMDWIFTASNRPQTPVSPLSDTVLDGLKTVYPEVSGDIERAKTSCQHKNRVPALLRSLGKRDGAPAEAAWIWEDNPFHQRQDPAGPTPDNPTLMEILGELKSVRALLAKLIGGG